MSEWIAEIQKIVDMQLEHGYLNMALCNCLDQMYAMQPMFEDDKDVSKAIKDAETALNFIKKGK